MTQDERERAALGGVVLVTVGYILLHAGKGGGWPWDWDLFSSGATDGEGKPGRPTTPAPRPSSGAGTPSPADPASGRTAPRVIEIYDPDIKLPDGRTVSGATYRRMLNEGYRP